MFDERTQHHNLQLPHASNQLDEDVERLRAALVQIDNLINWMTTKLSSDDPLLASLQALVDKLKIMLAALDFVESAPSVTLTYSGDFVSRAEETLADGRTRAVDYSYNVDGTLSTETITVDGESWVTAYSYENGKITNATRSSV